MIELYSMDLEGRQIDTQYGLVTYLEWIEREKTRIEQGKGRKADIIRKGGMVGLVVNEVDGCQCHTCQKLYPTKFKAPQLQSHGKP